MKFKWKGGGANLNENVQDSLETVNLKSSSNRNQVTSHLVGIRNSIIVSVVLKSSPVRDAFQKKTNFGTSAQRDGVLAKSQIWNITRQEGEFEGSCSKI